MPGRACRYVWPDELANEVYQRYQPEFSWKDGAQRIAGISGFASNGGRKRVDGEDYGSEGIPTKLKLLPLNHCRAPGKTRAENYQEDEVPAMHASGIHGFVQGDGDGSCRGVAV